ncbi:sulfite dehydrogenase (cytochrome) subunit SorB [Hydrogenobacter thermophilus TK-6]|uniref:Sulfite:cytochrome c oxidoreductase subunit B n=1 Tax=Hydrogenobacter thermophilus (strain DSM 6534 / IAM 12695 / TK-6) TaxID=608538 RepID=D3DHG5_HYDTT|nr:cytochrome c [Hydrogenobacter thermophilus]ADO45204.1 sulfite dehydrogenase (cytochrome) subunit SorB [Hydrogenobacter thermophilus TK-6]BAI69267.1 sulfite:cytochrome c oxidoreductase subunit B [Hydrogenobacter thermophilus TK-6]
MKRVMFFGFLLASLSFAGEEKVKLKDGEGKALVEANCSVCHSLDYIQMNSPFLDKKGWEAEVNKMIKVFGAPVKQEDVPKIVEYLTKYYGKKD